ncbi:MAG: LLM class flavin-dependent oxidoreductase [Rhodospirillaceae bacterium]
MKLSVLDQSTAAAGQPEDQAVRDTIELAAHCEALGYHRFWVSEHHNHSTIVGTAPEMIMAAIAQSTDRIRIGSAGVMLPHYAPFKVAEQFRILEALAPGRIDLGLGRAPGSDGKTAFALNPNAHEDAEHFPANVRDLMAWVAGEPLVEGHPFGDLVAHPQGTTSPEVWMLGTSDYGAQVAAHFGMPYCFAHFITDGRGVERALDIYRQGYRPSARFPKPVANVCAWALAAETEDAAEHLVRSRLAWKLFRDTGDLRAVEAPEAFDEAALSAAERARLDAIRSATIYGGAERVAERLRDVAAGYGIQLLVVLTWSYHQADRRRSYELLAEAFELEGTS